MSKAGIALAFTQKNIKIEQDVIFYYNNKVGKICDNKAVVDCMFQRSDLAEFLKNSNFVVSWETGIYDAMKQKGTQAKISGHEFHVKVYTLKKNADPLLRYLPLNKLQDLHLTIDLNNYEILFDGTMSIISLDDICDYFENQTERKPLMISDIISVDMDGWNYYYIDRRSYQEIDVESPTIEMGMDMSI